jgi:serine protease
VVRATEADTPRAQRRKTATRETEWIRERGLAIAERRAVRDNVAERFSRSIQPRPRVSTRQNAVAFLAIAAMLGLSATAPARAADSDPETASLWGLQSGSAWGIRAEDAWARSTGAGVVVGVIDTGIVPHIDLDANVVPGYDFISDPRVAEDGDGRDPDPYDSSELWHGTHVAGSIAAVRNGEGVVGVAPGARVQPIRVGGARGASTASDIAAAIRWGAGLPVDGVPANATPARVLNLSTAIPSATCPAAIQEAVDAAAARGVPVVVAAGNDDAALGGFYPGNCAGVIRVTATNPQGHLSAFSSPNVATNHGTETVPATIAAPGTHILSTVGSATAKPSAGYSYWEGTSMAAPYVAGTLALMVQANPNLTVTQLIGILAATSRAFPAGANLDGSDCSPAWCGAGIADASAAVTASVLLVEDEATPTPGATEPDESSDGPTEVPADPATTASPGSEEPTDPTSEPAEPTTEPPASVDDPATSGPETVTDPGDPVPANPAPASPTTAPVDATPASDTATPSRTTSTSQPSSTGSGRPAATAPSHSVPAPAAILQKSAPSVRGTFRAGHKLSSLAGTWTPAAARASYQWLRNGKTIKHATRSGYRLTRTDRGTEISLRVSVRLRGYTTLVMKVKAKRVR